MRLSRQCLPRELRVWQALICTRLTPTAHLTTSTFPVAQLLSDIIARQCIPVALHIFQAMVTTTTESPSLLFLGMITHFCWQVGVHVIVGEEVLPTPQPLTDARIQWFSNLSSDPSSVPSPGGHHSTS